MTEFCNFTFVIKHNSKANERKQEDKERYPSYMCNNLEEVTIIELKRIGKYNVIKF